jgi:hypothetical protein
VTLSDGENILSTESWDGHSPPVEQAEHPRRTDNTLSNLMREYAAITGISTVKLGIKKYRFAWAQAAMLRKWVNYADAYSISAAATSSKWMISND